ncbi:hypothetical protein llap_7407 [Limosa lapponica baueri]|uniref:Uncharacterized protein n=1 Tax=Limosa lapponica baueri TaxID=1758121 RepID=A0A2I0U8E2_LIMLA|nr:hypothetical protein llap_7407 [Limosa lapponica baueri]
MGCHETYSTKLKKFPIFNFDDDLKYLCISAMSPNTTKATLYALNMWRHWCLIKGLRDYMDITKAVTIHGCKHAVPLSQLSARCAQLLLAEKSGDASFGLGPHLAIPTSTSGHPLTDGEGLHSLRQMEALTYFCLGHEMMAKPQHNGQVYLVTVVKKEVPLPLLPNTVYCLF